MGRTRAAVGAWSGWALVGAALVSIAPRLIAQVFGTPDWYRPGPAAEGLTHLGVLVALVVVTLSVLCLAPASGSRSLWRFASLPPLIALGALGAVVAATASPESWAQSLWSLGRELSSVLLVVTVLMTVVVDTFRRTDLSSRDVTLRIAVASSAIWLVGVASAASPNFSWACFSPPVSAEATVWGVIDGYPARMFCGFTASGCVVASLVLHRRFGLGLLPLAGLASWMISRTLADVVTHTTALRVYLDGGLSPEEVTALARLAQHVGVTGYALALACWGFSATRSMVRSDRPQLDRDVWSSFWPVVPALIVSTSAAFEPSLVVRFPQQAPEATWEEVPDTIPMTWPDGDGNIPLFHTRLENVVTGVLTRDGDLHVFQGGRHEQLRFDVLAAPADHFWTDGVELVVDARATVGDLRRAARVLRQFAELSIVWRSNRLHEASSAARDRWGFVELAGRALRSRSIALITEGACDEHTIGSGPALRRRCAVEASPSSGRFEPGDVFVIESADDVSLSDWLVANASSEESPALLVSGAGLGPHERLESIGGLDRPRDPLSTRVAVPDLAGGLAAGALLFVIGILIAILRELATVRGLLRRGFIRGVAREAHEHLPSWVPAHLATLRILREDAGGPYRAESEVHVADAVTSWRELGRLAMQLAGGALRGVSTWLALAVVAGAIGVVLPLVIPGR